MTAKLTELLFHAVGIILNTLLIYKAVTGELWTFLGTPPGTVVMLVWLISGVVVIGKRFER